MKPIFLLLVMISSAMASMSEEASLNQDINLGSYFLMSDRSFFRNPAYLKDSTEQVYAESKGEIGLIKEDFAVVLGNDIGGAWQINEMSGLSGYFKPLNGKGVLGYGFTFGIDMSEFGAYIGFDKTKDIHFLPKIGFNTGAYGGKFYGEYICQLFSVPSYEFTFGYGKIYKNFFADLVYNQANDDKALSLTIGAMAKLLDKLGVMGSGKKELFFTGETKINAGLFYNATNKFDLGASFGVAAFDKDRPHYKDFDLTLSASYIL
ncbi:hypothetical protein MUP35_01660 [Patescibacteria group bacterium]|nr:hypothetical protein [Patescibacteria group bacterium]